MLLHYLQCKLDTTILYSLFEWNGYAIHDWAYLQLRKDSWRRHLFSEKSLTQSRCAMQQSYPNQPCSLYLPLSAGVDIRGGEGETAISGPPLSEIPRVHIESFALSLCLAFSSHRPNTFWNHQTHQFGHNVQQDKRPKGLSEKIGFCLVLLKNLRTTLKPHFNKFWSKSDVFQNITTIICKCAKGGSSTTILRHLSKSLPQHPKFWYSSLSVRLDFHPLSTLQ